MSGDAEARDDAKSANGLDVISRSAFDLRVVFETVAKVRSGSASRPNGISHAHTGCRHVATFFGLPSFGQHSRSCNDSDARTKTCS